MKRKSKISFLKANVANFLAMFAITIAGICANQFCVFIYHQPEMPETVRKLRKF